MSTQTSPTLFQMQRCRVCGNTRRQAGGNCPTCGQRNFVDYLAGPCGRCGVHRHGLDGACSACGYTRGALRPDEQAPTLMERLREFWKRIRRMGDEAVDGDAAPALDGETAQAEAAQIETEAPPAAAETGAAPEPAGDPVLDRNHGPSPDPAGDPNQSQPETFTERVRVAAVVELCETDAPDTGDACEHCAEQPEHHRYCDQCGLARFRSCRACNTANRAVALHCRHCGRPLDDAPAPVTGVPDAPAREIAERNPPDAPEPPPSTTASSSAAMEALG